MRKIILAGAAMLATTGVSFAQSTSITLETTVPRACSVAFADGSSLTVPADGTPSVGKTVNLSCNFVDTTADLTFTSTNLGVKDSSVGASLTAPQTYNISYAHNGGAAALLGNSTAPRIASSVLSSVGTTTGVFTAQLVAPITTAGTFTDTVTVSVVP
jgi:hypothetical protein